MSSLYKGSAFWDVLVTLCSQLNVNRRFGGTYHLSLQGWRASMKKEAGIEQEGNIHMTIYH
jgi:hypothetical protein